MSPQSQALDKPRKPYEKIEMHVTPTKPKVLDNHTHNWQNTCNSFLKVDLVASSLDTIYLKKKWSSLSNIASTNALVRLNINKPIIKVDTQPLYCIVQQFH
jgi:hypothetical protein